MIQFEQDIQIGEDAIHAVHHAAAGERFVVVAPPLFEEAVRLRKVLVNLGRYLRDAGLDVVRFDYFGTGYSTGEYDALSLERAQANLRAATQYCREQGASDVSVVGVRFGAYVAMQAAAATPGERRVLWEAVSDPLAYMKEVLRSEVATQMLIYGAVRQDRDQLVETLRSRGKVLVEGYSMGNALYEEMAAAAKLDVDEIAGSNTSLFYWQTRREHKRWLAAGARAHWADGVEFAFNHIRRLQPRHDGLFKKTLEELQTRA